MGKTQFTKPQNGQKTDQPLHGPQKKQFKQDKKLASILKNKLKSVLHGKNNAADTKDLIAEAKTQKSTAKFSSAKGGSSSNFASSVNEPATKSKKNNQNPKFPPKHQAEAKENAHVFPNAKIKSDKQINPQVKTNQKNDRPEKLNGFDKKAPAQQQQNKKKKQKNKLKKKQKHEHTESTTKKIANDKNTNKNKRNIHNDAKQDAGKKRLKTVSGFVESNADDVKQAKLIEEQLKKQGKKQSKSNDNSKEMQNQADKNAPKIKVHKVDERNSNDAYGDSSDSEADSYINKFFGDGDEDFDENRIYSMHELEAKNENGFLSKASGGVNNSDESSPSEKIRSNNVKKSNGKSKSKGSVKDAANSKLINYKKNAPSTGIDSNSDSDSNDCVMLSQEEDSSDLEESDYEDNFGVYGTDSDSDGSLGSEVIFSDESYECESTDIESMDEYEDDETYEDDEGESVSSSDMYEDFLNNDGHSSNEDHEYVDKDYDDLRIAQGTAVTYKITDERIKIFENDTESRIVELPKSDSDDEHCAELIPINVNKKKFQQAEKQKKLAKEAELQKQKEQAEKKRLEYENSVAEYYNMDELNKKSALQIETSISKTVSIIKCPKQFQHSQWIGSDCEDTQSEDNIELEYPKSKANAKVVVISAPDRIKTTKSFQKPPQNIAKIDEKSDESSSSLSQDYSMNSQECDSIEEDGNGSLNSENGMSQMDNGLESQFFNSVNSRHVLLLLRKTLHFHGSLHVKLIAGKAVVFGYELQPNKTVTAHSPRGHGLLYMSAGASGTPIKANLKALDDLKGDFYMQDIEYLSKEFNSATDAILLLERDQTNKGVNMIDRYMRETMFPNINAFNNESPFYSSEFVLHCKFLNDPENGLALNDQWQSLNLHKKSKVITIGGKGVGKSTLVRYLINSNFNKFQKFLYIDLDIGQPELFVPQTLSATVVTEPILGPGYLKNMKPAKAVLFGDINVLPNPIKYLRCVSEILQYCTKNQEFVQIPWVINTMGYSRGFGTELMACILKLIKPTDLIQIQSRSQVENFDQIIEAGVVNNFKFNVFEHEMSNISGRCQYKTQVFETECGKFNQKDMTAKDLRYTMILAKLGNCLKCNSDWLSSVKPFEASLNDLDVVVTSGEEVNPSDYLDLLNGNLVYLCGKIPENESDIVDCYGIGIVRSVDASTNKLYLLSTIPLKELDNVNVLAIGAIPMPSAVFLNQHNQIRGSVPYVYNSDKFVGSKQVVQHIFRAESNRNNKQIQLIEEH